LADPADPLQTGIEGPGETEEPARPSRFSARALNIIAVVCALILVAGTVLAVTFALKVRDNDSQNRDRARAQATAEQFALRMDNFDGAKLDAYINGITALLTTKAKTDFSSQFDAFKKVYSQGHAVGTGKVLAVGIGDSDSDSATVLVVHDATVKSDYGSQQRHFRWTISMTKVDGKWLVDNFSPVN
jgi:hypothetical protein